MPGHHRRAVGSSHKGSDGSGFRARFTLVLSRNVPSSQISSPAWSDVLEVVADDDELGDSGDDGAYACPVCLEDASRRGACALISSCGHVFCGACWLQCVAATSSAIDEGDRGYSASTMRTSSSSMSAPPPSLFSGLTLRSHSREERRSPLSLDDVVGIATATGGGAAALPAASSATGAGAGAPPSVDSFVASVRRCAPGLSSAGFEGVRLAAHHTPCAVCSVSQSPAPGGGASALPWWSAAVRQSAAAATTSSSAASSPASLSFGDLKPLVFAARERARAISLPRAVADLSVREGGASGGGASAASGTPAGEEVKALRMPPLASFAEQHGGRGPFVPIAVDAADARRAVNAARRGGARGGAACGSGGGGAGVGKELLGAPASFSGGPASAASASASPPSGARLLVPPGAVTRTFAVASPTTLSGPMVFRLVGVPTTSMGSSSYNPIAVAAAIPPRPPFPSTSEEGAVAASSPLSASLPWPPCSKNELLQRGSLAGPPPETCCLISGPAPSEGAPHSSSASCGPTAADAPCSPCWFPPRLHYGHRGSVIASPTHASAALVDLLLEIGLAISAAEAEELAAAGELRSLHAAAAAAASSEARERDAALSRHSEPLPGAWGDKKAVSSLRAAGKDGEGASATASRPAPPLSPTDALRASMLKLEAEHARRCIGLLAWAAVRTARAILLSLIDGSAASSSAASAAAAATASLPPRSSSSGGGSGSSVGASSPLPPPSSLLYVYQCASGAPVFLHPASLFPFARALALRLLPLPSAIVARPLQLDIGLTPPMPDHHRRGEEAEDYAVVRQRRALSPALGDLPPRAPFGLVEVETRAMGALLCTGCAAAGGCGAWQRFSVPRAAFEWPELDLWGDFVSRRTVRERSLAAAAAAATRPAAVAPHRSRDGAGRGEGGAAVSNERLMREFMGITDMRFSSFETGHAGTFRDEDAWRSFLESAPTAPALPVSGSASFVAAFPALPPPVSASSALAPSGKESALPPPFDCLAPPASAAAAPSPSIRLVEPAPLGSATPGGSASTAASQWRSLAAAKGKFASAEEAAAASAAAKSSRAAAFPTLPSSYPALSPSSRTKAPASSASLSRSGGAGVAAPAAAVLEPSFEPVAHRRLELDLSALAIDEAEAKRAAKAKKRAGGKGKASSAASAASALFSDE